MPGCCLAALVLFLGPRVVLLSAWLMSDWYDAFDTTWVAVLGWLLLPWTSLSWIYIHFHNGGAIEGGYVLLMILAVLADLGTFGGSQRARQRRRE